MGILKQQKGRTKHNLLLSRRADFHGHHWRVQVRDFNFKVAFLAELASGIPNRVGEIRQREVEDFLEVLVAVSRSAFEPASALSCIVDFTKEKEGKEKE